MLNYDSALPGTRPYADGAVVRRGMLAPLHILRTVGRILLGFAFGKSAGNGLLPAHVDPQSIPVGVESIAASKTLFRLLLVGDEVLWMMMKCVVGRTLNKTRTMSAKDLT